MKYFIIYLEIEHMLNFLSQSEKGDFLDLMIAYAKKQEEPAIENKNVANVFNFIRGRLDTQFEKARLKAEVARKNGVGGGRPADKKKPKKTNPKPKITQSVIPNFIDASLWNSFLEMRKSKKAKPTEKAIELIIKELTKFHNKGLDANQSLENSIKSNWTGVFEPKNNNQNHFLTSDQRRRQTNADSTEKFLNKHGVENA